MLAEDFEVQTKTESYIVPGQLPVELMLPVEDWSMRSQALAVEATESDAKADELTEEESEKEARRLMNVAVDMAMEGWDLVTRLVNYNHPAVVLADIKRALPTMEAIALFFNAIFEEYQPEGINDPLPGKAPAKKPGTTTRSTKSGKVKPKKK